MAEKLTGISSTEIDWSTRGINNSMFCRYHTIKTDVNENTNCTCIKKQE